MLKKFNLLIATSALAVSVVPFTPVMAAAPVGFAGTVGGSYGQVDCDGCTDSSDAWGIAGSGAFGFGGAFGAQIERVLGPCHGAAWCNRFLADD